jgi:type I restriction enzyme S subunit
MGWQVVELRDVISHRKEFIEIAPSEIYSRCRVQTSTRGIVLRDRVAGSEIKTPQQQVCRTGEFLVAEIDAKLGGYGIVPEELNDAIVSSHYFLFEINEHRLLRGFLDWYSRTPAFLEQVKARGSTNYAAIRPSNVLGYQIPLPSLDEQRLIVHRLDMVAALVAERRRAIEAAERETQALLLKAFQRAIDGAPLRPMSEVAPLVRRPVEIEAQKDYTEIGVRSFYNGIFHRRTMPGSEFSWQDLFWIKEGDLVFSNLMAWEKAIAVASPHDEGTVGNHRMLTCEINPDVATPRFLMAYFRTFEGFSSVVGHSPGTIARNKTLSSKKLPTILVPVPSLETQSWFDQLESKAREARAIRASTAQDVDALIPAMLHEIFNGKAAAA